MNILGLDFGLRRIGVAYSQDGLISTLPLLANDNSFTDKITSLIKHYQIVKIYVGLSEKDPVRGLTLQFVDTLREMVKLPIETVEESVSTLEATKIYQANFGKKKLYKSRIDSVSAAVILNRVIS